MWFETRNGEKEFLHPLVLDEIGFGGLQRYQFVQTSNKGFKIRTGVEDEVEMNRVKEHVQEQVDEFLEEKMLTHLDYTVVEEDIPIDPETGERKMVIKETEKGEP